MVVFRSISAVRTPPSVSIPTDNGVTSRSRTSFTSPCSTPAWIAAPIATTSSGLIVRLGSLPNNAVTNSMTAGMRVIPPTSTTSSISPGPIFASLRAAFVGAAVRSISAEVSSSSFALVSVD